MLQIRDPGGSRGMAGVNIIVVNYNMAIKERNTVTPIAKPNPQITGLCMSKFSSISRLKL